MGHQFLTDAWVEAVAAIQDEYFGRVDPPSAPLRLNAVIRGAPFSSEDLRMSLDTSGGVGVVTPGHLQDAMVTVTTDYATAKTLFVDADPQGVMQAFMSGKVLVQGDLAALIEAVQGAGAPDETRDEITARVKAITDI